MRLTIIVVLVIAALFVGGGIYVASGLRNKIEDKLAADQALVDGSPRQPHQTPTADTPTGETPPEQPAPDEAPTVPHAVALIETLAIRDFHVQQSTGVFVTADGRMLTSTDNVNGRVVLSVTLQDGTPLNAAVVGQDRAKSLSELQVGTTADVPYLETTDEAPGEGAKVWIVTTDSLISGTIMQREASTDGKERVKVQADGLQDNARGAAVVDREGKIWGIVQHLYSTDAQTALVGIIRSQR